MAHNDTVGTRCPTCGQDLPGTLVVIDLTTNTLISGGVAIRLTRREAELAELLWSKRPRAMPREEIADRIFRETADGLSHIRSLVFRLRRKMASGGVPAAIQTTAGDGYRWVDYGPKQ